MTTSSVTVDQQIGMFQTAHRKLRVRAIIIEVYLSTLSTTAVYLGTLKLQINNTDWLGPFQATNTASGALFGIVIPFSKHIDVENPQTIEALCTPAAVTSTVWVVTVVGDQV